MKRFLIFAAAVVAIYLCTSDPWREQRETLRIRQEREDYILKLTKKT
jgi:hypothetical protein